MLTPSQLAIKPKTADIVVPEYNFIEQNRWDGTLMAGSYTSNSIQTFDSKGKPHDAQSDRND